jgi:hypothetical protein
MTFSVTTLNITTLTKHERHHAECRISFIIMVNVIILNVDIMNVIILSVEAPFSSRGGVASCFWVN